MKSIIQINKQKVHLIRTPLKQNGTVEVHKHGCWRDQYRQRDNIFRTTTKRVELHLGDKKG